MQQEFVDLAVFIIIIAAKCHIIQYSEVYIGLPEILSRALRGLNSVNF